MPIRLAVLADDVGPPVVGDEAEGRICGKLAESVAIDVPERLDGGKQRIVSLMRAEVERLEHGRRELAQVAVALGQEIAGAGFAVPSSEEMAMTSK